MDRIQTETAPAPGGHYAQATVHDGTIYVSGQLSIDPVTGDKRPGSIEEQTRQVLENVVAVVRAAGGDLDTILKVTVFVADVKLWGAVNEVYSAFFGEHRPARAIVPTGALHYGFLIEIDAVAHVK